MVLWTVCLTLVPPLCRQRVAEVMDSWWHSMLILPPLLKDSPADPFLIAYYPDCVGMSPSGSPCNIPLSQMKAEQLRAPQTQGKRGGGLPRDWLLAARRPR